MAGKDNDYKPETEGSGAIMHVASEVPGGPSAISFTPVLTASSAGYSMGWTEEQRELFTPGALATVMWMYTGASHIVEACELVFHYWHGRREAVAPHVSKEGSVFGFVFNVCPLMVDMKNKIEQQHPAIARKFEQLKQSDEFKAWSRACEAGDNKKADESLVSVKGLLTNTFGANIRVARQVDSMPRDPVVAFMDICNNKPIIFAAI